MGRFAWCLLSLSVALTVGCAGTTARIPRPGDFPFHSSDNPFFDLHWRLDRTDGVVRAVGLVEAARVDGVDTVVVELQEIDADGRVVNSAQGLTYGGHLLRWDWRPFTVQLRPKNEADRFEVKVSSFTWWLGRT